MSAPGLWFDRQSLPGNYDREVTGSLKFPSYPYEYMPRSQTPVASNLTRHNVREDCCLPLTALRRLSLFFGRRDYPYGPRLYIFRGSIPRPALLLHPASYTPLPECTRVHYGPAG